MFRSCQRRFLFCLLLLVGCSDTTKLRKLPDAGLVCGVNERLSAGECVFTCDRDSDCGVTERCNLFTGACEPKPPPKDGGMAVPVCTTGATRCRADGAAVEVCGEEGTWKDQTACGAEGLCENGSCLQCLPGETRCDPADATVVQLCPEDGHGFITLACAAGASCQMGECRQCTPSETRCSPDNRSVQTCQKQEDPAQTWTWQNTGDAFDGTCVTQQCLPGAPPRCKPPDCLPGTIRCGATAAVQETCSAGGTWVSQTCASIAGMSPDAQCENGVCVDECANAAKEESYFGCEYWTAIQDNSMNPAFKGGVMNGQGTADSEFAFAVANRSVGTAEVKIFRSFGGMEQLVKTVTVDGRNGPSKGLSVIKVPWQSVSPACTVSGVALSGLHPYAYRLTSTRPVTVYQFNPLDAVIYNRSFSSCKSCLADLQCSEYPPGGTCTNGYCAYVNAPVVYSYSNDASLLLPAHILGNQYVAVSLPHVGFAKDGYSAPVGNGNGHITIVATQNGTRVKIKSSAVTGSGNLFGGMTKGQTTTTPLNRYDVMQVSTVDLGASYIECAPNPFNPLGTTVTCRVDNDLTGTVVESVDAAGNPDPSRPIAVFGGAACAMTPHSAVACDHMEEQIFPFSTWGKQFVVKKSHPVKLTSGVFASASQMSPDYYKVVASCPLSQCPGGTLITFSTPPLAADELLPNRCLSGTLASNDCRLAGGSYMEFRSKADFAITADQPIAVAQIFSGQGATAGTAAQGDPSLILLPPAEQWRAEYTVQAAPGMADNFLAISIDGTKVQSVAVDGVILSGFSPVAGTSYQVINHPVSVGVHTVAVSPKPGQATLPGAGVVVYGYDDYVSYGYTGGLDLGSIVLGIDPGG